MPAPMKQLPLSTRAQSAMPKSEDHEAAFHGEADKDYAGLSSVIRKAFGKQLRFLPANRSHPSLNAKKIQRGARRMASQSNAGLEILLQDRWR
jgi:hypothetical protein